MNLTPADKDNIRKKQYLSKSDYKLARDCAVKLYYKKKNYPAVGTDDYMQLLADCGYIVGKMAQLYYPKGVEIDTGGDLVAGAQTTMEHLQKTKPVTLFEPVLYHNHALIRADVFVKNKNKIDLIEVKSKGFKSEKTSKGTFLIDKSIFRNTKGFAGAWIDYLLDVAYQTWVVKQIFPECQVRSYLMMPDKAKTTSIDSLIQQFALKKKSSASGRHQQIVVEFSGNQQDILNDDLLTLVDVTAESLELETVIADEFSEFAKIVQSGFQKIAADTGKQCKSCEFSITDAGLNGFQECWGGPLVLNSDGPKDHIFDLYFGGAIKSENGFLLDDLHERGKESIYDIPQEYLKGKRGERQKIQIEYTRKNKEWFSGELNGILNSWDYPLQFMDFETSRIAVPYHKGMSPYENIAFQWSLHIIEKPDSKEIAHKEWINIEEAFPNFKFAESLKNALDEKGTIFMWATHENTVLRDIYNQMEKYDFQNEVLRKWLYRIVKFDSEDTGKLVDMNKLTLDHYFHPDMGGRTSLKFVLPAVWNNHGNLHELPWFKPYFKLSDKKFGGRVMNPYDTLEKIDIYEEAEVVKEGGGAMMAYQEMMYGASRGDHHLRDSWKDLLLQYCKLDTMAMVIVWQHWKDITAANK